LERATLCSAVDFQTWASVGLRQQRARSRANRGVPEEDATPPRAAPREQAFPWDVRILRPAGVSRPVEDDWGGEAVCGRGVVGGFRRGGITNGTAKIPSAGGRCGVGRRPSGNGSAAPRARDANGMRRRNASGENSGRLRPPSHRKVIPPLRRCPRSLARGHAEESFPRLSAIAPVVTSPSGILLALGPRTVAMTAAHACVGSETANGSACGARAKRVDSNAAWSTRRHGPNAGKVMWLPATPRPGSPRRMLVRSNARSFSIGVAAMRP